jgi:hypothetical protein
MVGYEALATLDIQHYSWAVLFYELTSDDVALAPSDFVPAKQRVRPMHMPIMPVWPPQKFPWQVGGRGARSRGRGGRRGSGRGDEPDVDLGMDRPPEDVGDSAAGALEDMEAGESQESMLYEPTDSEEWDDERVDVPLLSAADQASCRV